jgi:hypothetical protein
MPINLELNAILIGVVCLVAGFAAGRFYPAPHYVHIGAITMYNERTGHICHGLRNGIGIAEEKSESKASGDPLDAIYGPAPGAVAGSKVPFCGEEDK